MAARTPYHECVLSTVRGDIGVRHYPCPGALSGIVWVGGIGGFWDGSAGDLYSHLSEALLADDIASLRVNLQSDRLG